MAKNKKHETLQGAIEKIDRKINKEMKKMKKK
jgi:hypothetical protein